MVRAILALQQQQKLQVPEDDISPPQPPGQALDEQYTGPNSSNNIPRPYTPSKPSLHPTQTFEDSLVADTSPKIDSRHPITTSATTASSSKIVDLDLDENKVEEPQSRASISRKSRPPSKDHEVPQVPTHADSEYRRQQARATHIY